MDQKNDYTLYNKIKAKFFPVQGALTLISLTSKNVEELVPQIFTENNDDEYYDLISHHQTNFMAYVVLRYRDDGVPSYFYICEDFLQQENLATGQIIRFRKNPFEENRIDINEVRKELQKLAQLLGDSKAS